VLEQGYRGGQVLRDALAWPYLGGPKSYAEMLGLS
jgi:hypothetical protein